MESVIREIRQKALAVEFRAKSDPAYLQQLKDDPISVLRAAGFDDSLTQEIAAELRGEISGPCGDWCDGITCIITSCCFLTADGPPAV